MKQKTILRAVLTAVLSLVATAASAHDFEVNGIYYKNNGGGTVSVTYQGLYYDEYDDEYTGDVVIPSSVTYSETTYSVTSIDDYAFRGCSGLTSVTIPNSITSIGYEAFRYCIDLKSVSIPNSVTSIDDSAFWSCSVLTSINIPNSVTSIGDWAFNGCSGLTSVSIPNSVNSIGYAAFSGCSGLESIVVESGNSKYDSRDNCNAIIETATNTLLAGCKNTTIPNSVTSIGGRAFEGCSGLTSITIPNSVTSISNYAFLECSGLTSVSIPNSVTSIGNYAFEGCRGLESIVVESGNSKYDSRDNCNAIIETATNTLLVGCNNTIIPNSVTSIGSSAFEYCTGLTSVTIPNSVTSIGKRAFDQCYGLTSVSIPNSVTSIGDWAFNGCSGLTSVTIPNSVTSIGRGAFNGCSGLTSVTSKAVTPPTCGTNSFSSNAYTTAKLYVPSGAIAVYKEANVWGNFTTIEGIGTNDAENVADLIEGTNKVKFGLQGVKMHNGVLYACTTAKSVNESTPTFHSNDAGNMAPYEDRNFAEFDQRDWVAISGLEDGFVGKELSYPFVATFADGVLTPSETINTKAHATAYNLNTFRAENILHGGYSNYAEGAYKAYYVPARVNEVAKFMGLIENVGGVKYLYSNNAYGRKEGEGIKIEGSIADNSESYSLLEGILVADASTKAGVKIIMLDYVGEATGVEGVDTAAARIYTANGNIIIAAVEEGEAAVYDFTGRLIKSVPVASGDSTVVPVTPGYYIVKTGTKTQSVIVK